LTDDYFKKSPLDVAIYVTHTATLAFLIERGAMVPHLTFWLYREKEMFEVLRQGRIAQTDKSVVTWEQSRKCWFKEV
jgi:hypothetical protein